MANAMAHVVGDGSAVTFRTTEGPCLTCVLAHSLDDDRPKLGTITWAVRPVGRLMTGVPTDFTCPDGHTSDDDPALLKAFQSRLF
jgi:hypothetical protein